MVFGFFRRKRSVWDALQDIPEFQQQKELYDELGRLCDNGIDADELPNGSGEFGLVPSNPIPTRTPFGSISYLVRLRAEDGTKVLYERTGSISSSVCDMPVDIYEISHENGHGLATLYVSAYQKRNSGKAPRGFTFAETMFGGGEPSAPAGSG